MIEELTPQILMMSMFLIIGVAPILTLLLCTLLLWRYRRAVKHAMEATVGFHGSGAEAPPAGSPPSGNPTIKDPTVRPRSRNLYQRAIRAPRHNAMRYSVAWLSSALVFALAAHFVYPSGLELPGFLNAVWIYLWPVVLALALIGPHSMRPWAVYIAVYFVVFCLLGLWASTINNLPEYSFGAVFLPARSSVTPWGMIELWLVVNGAPTALMLLCFNRRVRAVAPLVLALVTTAISGMWFVALALFSPRGVNAVVTLAESLDVHVVWFVVAIYLLSLAGFGAIGWALARWIARAYRHSHLSDQSLRLDALWLLFASTYSMWLVSGGLAWIATVPAAFLAYKLALAAGARIPRRESSPGVGLIFLRVFSLGRRSEALLEDVARYWRHIGGIHMITGPDVVGSTVQPHQFLDFLSAKLARHFVRDPVSLERSIAERDRTADPDGRFRINNFFCHEDSWRLLLPRLIQEGDPVLMDLRSFSAKNDGCIYELQYLFQQVPFSSFLLVVEGTIKPFLEQKLKEILDQLPPSSPNYRRSLDEVAVYNFGSGTVPLRRLVHRLCDAAST